eukprot:1636626-Pyramimonas_sp.AAC.1
MLRVPTEQVKEIIGKAANIAVGGATKDKTDKPDYGDGKEPPFYHCHPLVLDSEVSHSWPAVGHVDLTVGTGGRALYCVVHKLPYIGFCLTEAHKTAVIEFLETKTWEIIQQEGSPIYQPALAALFAEKGEPHDDEGHDGN